MHNNWEELIPFYIAGTLPKPDTSRLENHLAGCDDCRQALDDWRAIASVVRADAASQLSVLPPLAPQVLQIASQQAALRRYQTPAPALIPPQPRTRASATSITLIAAVFTVIFFGGLVTFMLLRIPREPDSANTVLLPTSTLSATVTPSESGAASPAAPPQIIVIEPSVTLTFTPTFTPSPTLVVPTFIFPTSVVPTYVAPTYVAPASALPSETPLQFSALNPQASLVCTLHAAIPNTIVNLYAGPGTNYAVVKTFGSDDQLTALGKSDNGWYRAQYQPDNNQWIGWVRQELVYTSGFCDALPLIAAADYATDTPAASATASAIPPIIDAPVAIVSADGVNLRSGPGTNYPIIGSASLGASYHVEAESTNQNQIWYLITIPGARSAWIFGDLAQLSPANALIAPAMTVPPSPPPTATPSPTPTPTDSPTLPPTPSPTTSIASDTAFACTQVHQPRCDSARLAL